MQHVCGGAPTNALETEHDTSEEASASAHKDRRRPGRLTIITAPVREDRHSISAGLDAEEESLTSAAADFDFSMSTEEFYGVWVPGGGPPRPLQPTRFDFVQSPRSLVKAFAGTLVSSNCVGAAVTEVPPPLTPDMLPRGGQQSAIAFADELSPHGLSLIHI